VLRVSHLVSGHGRDDQDITGVGISVVLDIRRAAQTHPPEQTINLQNRSGVADGGSAAFRS
jgi:hypothetical protein